MPTVQTLAKGCNLDVQKKSKASKTIKKTKTPQMLSSGDFTAGEFYIPLIPTTGPVANVNLGGPSDPYDAKRTKQLERAVVDLGKLCNPVSRKSSSSFTLLTMQMGFVVVIAVMYVSSLTEIKLLARTSLVSSVPFGEVPIHVFFISALGFSVLSIRNTLLNTSAG